MLSSLSSPGSASIWWKDLCLIGSDLGSIEDWFGERFAKKIGNGCSTSFWHDVWVGSQPLRVAFPRLFLVSNCQDGCVVEFGSWVERVWWWHLQWRRRLFVWEEELVEELLGFIRLIPSVHEEDSWVWRGDPSGVFSVKSAYMCLLEGESALGAMSDVQVSTLGRLWLSLAPPKVIAFSWQLLLDRLPTRDNLLWRKVIIEPSHALCSICGDFVKISLNLFLRCPIAMKVWYAVLGWLGWQMPLPPNLASLFLVFGGFGHAGREKRGLSLIWHSVIWLLWDMRNGWVYLLG